MINRLIELSLKNRVVVILLFVSLAGLGSARAPGGCLPEPRPDREPIRRQPVRLVHANGRGVHAARVWPHGQPGDTIVVKGSFSVRAERERLGLRPAAAAKAPGGASVSQTQDGIRVTVSEQGYQPARVSVRAGAVARITFVRTSDATCGTEVAIPALNIKRALPLNQPVTLEHRRKRERWSSSAAWGCSAGPSSCSSYNHRGCL